MNVGIELVGIVVIYSASKGPDATIFSSLQIILYIRKFSGSIRIRKYENFFRKFQNQKFPRRVKEDKEDKKHILKNVWHLFGPFMTKPPKIRPQVCSA
jgi:hypothetical protein